MNIESAVRAGQLAAQIATVQKHVTDIEQVLSERWPVSALIVRAPKESTSAEGTEIDLLAGIEIPIADLWKIALTTARDLHQSALSALNAELEAL